MDWPQQSRMIEFVRNPDSTLSLVLTMLDHDGPENPGGAPPGSDGLGQAGEEPLRLASMSRELAYNDYQPYRTGRGSREDRNVIIKTDRPWPYPDRPGEGG